MRTTRLERSPSTASMSVAIPVWFFRLGFIMSPSSIVVIVLQPLDVPLWAIEVGDDPVVKIEADEPSGLAMKTADPGLLCPIVRVLEMRTHVQGLLSAGIVLLNGGTAELVAVDSVVVLQMLRRLPRGHAWYPSLAAECMGDSTSMNLRAAGAALATCPARGNESQVRRFRHAE